MTTTQHLTPSEIRSQIVRLSGADARCVRLVDGQWRHKGKPIHPWTVHVAEARALELRKASE